MWMPKEIGDTVVSSAGFCDKHGRRPTRRWTVLGLHEHHGESMKVSLGSHMRYGVYY